MSLWKSPATPASVVHGGGKPLVVSNRWGAWALLVLTSLSVQVHGQVTYELTQVDSGAAWVSSYWGYNAPKLVYDGTTYYTVGLWGTDQASAVGRVYKYQDGQWIKGYQFNPNYQPAMLLMDSQKRLILIFSRMSGSPVVMRANATGDFNNFIQIPSPSNWAWGGYMGAGIYNDKIVIGYIGGDAVPSGGDKTYSWHFITHDLKTNTWTNPVLLALAQRTTEPFTTWLYPVILPNADGFHMLFSNNADASSYYDRINYTYVPFNKPALLMMDLLADCTPWKRRIAFGTAMWRAQDGSLYATGMHQVDSNASNYYLFVYRRDPQTGQWTRSTPVNTAQPSAVFQTADDPDTLWLTETWFNQIKLFRSTDQGGNWQEMALPDFSSYGFTNSFFLYGINPSSGSVMPDGPAAVFSTSVGSTQTNWFIKFKLPTPTATPTATVTPTATMTATPTSTPTSVPPNNAANGVWNLMGQE